jgi:hypothetical protein
MTRDSWICAGVATLLVVAAFARGFGMYPFYDDWMYLSAAGAALAHHAPGEFIWSAFPPHWSPLSFAFWIFNLRFVGWESDALIRMTNAVMVWAGLMGFSIFARWHGASRLAVVAGMATLGWHHINAAPYYAWDSFDQLAADLLSWASVALMITIANRSHAHATRRVAQASALVAPALLIKEEALAAVAGIVLVAIWSSVLVREDVTTRRMRWSAAAATLAMAAGFAALRWHAGLWFDASGPYRFCAACIPGNAGLMLASQIVPVRTLDVFLAVHDWPPDLTVAIRAVLATLAVVPAVAFGLLSRSREDRQLVTLYALLMLASGFPILLQGNVTELHAHTGLFWWALLVTLAVDGWRRRMPSARGAARLALAGVPAVYALALGIGLQSNLAEMRATGERSRAWRARLQASLSSVAPGSRVLVRGVPLVKLSTDYGLYRVSTPGYLLAGIVGLAWRSPLHLEFCGDADACEEPPQYVLEVDAHERVRISQR